jgi:hypothetical protein
VYQRREAAIMPGSVNVIPDLAERLAGHDADREDRVRDRQGSGGRRPVRSTTRSSGRTAVFTSDERTMYAQLSYLNGFVEYDLTAGKVTRTVQLPFSPQGRR